MQHNMDVCINDIDVTMFQYFSLEMRHNQATKLLFSVIMLHVVEFKETFFAKDLYCIYHTYMWLSIFSSTKMIPPQELL